MTEPDQEIDIRVTETGYGSLKPITVIEAFKTTVANHGDCNALASQTKVNVWNGLFYSDASDYAVISHLQPLPNPSGRAVRLEVLVLEGLLQRLYVVCEDTGSPKGGQVQDREYLGLQRGMTVSHHSTQQYLFPDKVGVVFLSRHG